MAGLWDMMDMAIAEELGVDVKTYIRIVERECTEEESSFIIMTVMEEDTENLEKAKAIFNKYLEDDKKANL
jgi:hypothetical protein